MYGTRISYLDDNLEIFKGGSDYEALFKFATGLAMQLVESDRSGRRFERAVGRNVTKRRMRKIMHQSVLSVLEEDEYSPLEHWFMNKWGARNDN